MLTQELGQISFAQVLRQAAEKQSAEPHTNTTTTAAETSSTPAAAVRS